jgi:tripartite ATP-independent transporter DctP family solute receptor
MKRIGIVLCVVVFLLAFLPGVGTAQKVTLRAADVQPPDYPTVKGLLFMGEYVKARSGGRVEIQVFPGGQLGDERSTIEQVKLGVIDIVRTSTSPVGEFYGPIGVYGLPFIFRDESHMWKVVQGPIGSELLEGLKQADMVGLAYYDSGSRNFYTTKKPVRRPEDMKGLKVRVQPARIMIDMVEALGASAVPIAFGEVYSSLQTGVIDGAENNYPSYGPFGVRHYEVAKHFTLSGHSRIPEVVIISKKSWEKLSPADRELIREAALASVPYQASLWDDVVDRTKEELAKAKVEIISVDVPAFQKAVAKVYEKYRPKYGALVDRVMAVK